MSLLIRGKKSCLCLGCKPPFDPENLLGVIPTTFLAYLGVQAGRILGLISSIKQSSSRSSF